MTGQPHTEPIKPAQKAPNQPKQGKDIAPKLGRDQPGRGLDTGVDTGAIQPGASGDSAALD